VIERERLQPHVSAVKGYWFYDINHHAVVAGRKGAG
jgi:hypothetical protein